MHSYVSPPNHVEYGPKSSPAGTAVLPAINAADRTVEQNWAIYRMAFNKAREDDLEMIQDGLEKDPAFKQLVFLWQKTLEQRWYCSCCREDVNKAARRVRVALRRVVTYKQRLPPIGPPLIRGDQAPIEAHTPTYRRDVQEQLHILNDKAFRHSKLATDLAENIILAYHAEKAEDARRDSSGAGAADTRMAGCGSRRELRAHRSGVLSTQGGDIGPGGPEQRISPLSPASSLSSGDVIHKWLENAHLQSPFDPEQSSLATRRGTLAAGSEAPLSGRPSDLGVQVNPAGTRSSTQAGLATIEPIPAQATGLRVRTASGVSEPGGTASRPASVVPSEASEHLPESYFDKPNVDSRLLTGGLASPPRDRSLGTVVDSISDLRQRASGEGSQATAAVTVSQLTARRTASKSSEGAAPTRIRRSAKEQNFGDSNRERRILVAAAHRNLRRNEIEPPIPQSPTTGQRRTGRRSNGSESSGGSGSSSGDDSPPLRGPNQNVPPSSREGRRSSTTNNVPPPSHGGLAEATSTNLRGGNVKGDASPRPKPPTEGLREGAVKERARETEKAIREGR